MMAPGAARSDLPHWRLRWGGRLLVLEAAATLSLAALALKLLPFRHVARLMIGKAGPADAPLRRHPDLPQPVIARRVARAVTRASSLLPFPTLCLPQAMAARIMLRNRGHATLLHLSVQLGTGVDPSAHAWLTLNGQAVIGGGAPAGQVEVARFT